MATVERVEEALREPPQVGGTRILAARVRLGEDSNGDKALFVKLMLSDPAPGHETWPADDLTKIRRAIRDVITAADPELKVPWVISFVPESAGDLEPEDTHGEVQIDF